MPLGGIPTNATGSPAFGMDNLVNSAQATTTTTQPVTTTTQASDPRSVVQNPVTNQTQGPMRQASNQAPIAMQQNMGLEQALANTTRPLASQATVPQSFSPIVSGQPGASNSIGNTEFNQQNLPGSMTQSPWVTANTPHLPSAGGGSTLSMQINQSISARHQESPTQDEKKTNYANLFRGGTPSELAEFLVNSSSRDYSDDCLQIIDRSGKEKAMFAFSVAWKLYDTIGEWQKNYADQDKVNGVHEQLERMMDGCMKQFVMAYNLYTQIAQYYQISDLSRDLSGIEQVVSSLEGAIKKTYKETDVNGSSNLFREGLRMFLMDLLHIFSDQAENLRTQSRLDAHREKAFGEHVHLKQYNVTGRELTNMLHSALVSIKSEDSLEKVRIVLTLYFDMYCVVHQCHANPNAVQAILLLALEKSGFLQYREIANIVEKMTNNNFFNSPTPLKRDKSLEMARQWTEEDKKWLFGSILDEVRCVYPYSVEDYVYCSIWLIRKRVNGRGTSHAENELSYIKNRCKLECIGNLDRINRQFSSFVQKRKSDGDKSRDRCNQLDQGRGVELDLGGSVRSMLLETSKQVPSGSSALITGSRNDTRSYDTIADLKNYGTKQHYYSFVDLSKHATMGQKAIQVLDMYNKQNRLDAQKSTTQKDMALLFGHSGEHYMSGLDKDHYTASVTAALAVSSEYLSKKSKAPAQHLSKVGFSALTIDLIKGARPVFISAVNKYNKDLHLDHNFSQSSILRDPHSTSEKPYSSSYRIDAHRESNFYRAISKTFSNIREAIILPVVEDFASSSDYSVAFASPEMESLFAGELLGKWEMARACERDYVRDMVYWLFTSMSFILREDLPEYKDVSVPLENQKSSSRKGALAMTKRILSQKTTPSTEISRPISIEPTSASGSASKSVTDDDRVSQGADTILGYAKSLLAPYVPGFVTDALDFLKDWAVLAIKGIKAWFSEKGDLRMVDESFKSYDDASKATNPQTKFESMKKFILYYWNNVKEKTEGSKVLNLIFNALEKVIGVGVSIITSLCEFVVYIAKKIWAGIKTVASFITEGIKNGLRQLASFIYTPVGNVPCMYIWLGYQGDIMIKPLGKTNPADKDEQAAINNKARDASKSKKSTTPVVQKMAENLEITLPFQFSYNSIFMISGQKIMEERDQWFALAFEGRDMVEGWNIVTDTGDIAFYLKDDVEINFGTIPLKKTNINEHIIRKKDLQDAFTKELHSVDLVDEGKMRLLKAVCYLYAVGIEDVNPNSMQEQLDWRYVFDRQDVMGVISKIIRYLLSMKKRSSTVENIDKVIHSADANRSVAWDHELANECLELVCSLYEVMHRNKEHDLTVKVSEAADVITKYIPELYHMNQIIRLCRNMDRDRSFTGHMKEAIKNDKFRASHHYLSLFALEYDTNP